MISDNTTTLISVSDSSTESNEYKEGYLKDFISGKWVRNTPEEREAVQVFSEILVNDYQYPKDRIRTRPQWRVKVCPSDTKKEYPVDIAVFSDSNKTDDNIQIIVECKKKNRKDGRSQLEDYLRLSKARIGVWFNGSERLYIEKKEKDGKVDFVDIPNIPRCGQRLEDVGLFKRSELAKAINLKIIFKAIRNYLAANAVGITRDEVFAQQLINLIFCKIYDERFTKNDCIVTFRAGLDEKCSDVKERIDGLFKKVKKQYKDVIKISDEITLDERSLTYIVGELQNYSLIAAERDAVAEAFEIFIGPSLKGGQGQFFTPRNVVKMVVDMVDPDPDARIIDPACGSGGFLVEALRHVWRKVDENGKDFAWPESEISTEKQRVAINNFRGIDKDEFLSKVAKAYMAILGDGRGGVYCENSLESPDNWEAKTKTDIKLGTFDIVLTNPPFGKKLAIDAQEILKTYDLGHVWNYDKQKKIYEKGKLQDKQPPQILFIERCFDLLKPGGKLGIVLLESIFGMPKYRYVVDFITRRSKLLAIVALPEDLFQPNTHAKTCVIICQKIVEPITTPYDIFMCDVEWCGHDSRGNPTYKVDKDGKHVILDEIPDVAPLFRKGVSK
jgi:type I restriction enzyme M protein